MDTETNRRTVLRYYDAYNRRDFEAVADCLADDFVAHSIPQEAGSDRGPEAFVDWLKGFEAAFPDTRWEPLDTIAEDDLVAVRALGTATHEGDFMGIPATGRSIEIEATDIVRCNDDGEMVEFRDYTDNLVVLQQLGLGPDELAS